jgi:hypothetical protein
VRSPHITHGSFAAARVVVARALWATSLGGFGCTRFLGAATPLRATSDEDSTRFMGLVHVLTHTVHGPGARADSHGSRSWCTCGLARFIGVRLCAEGVRVRVRLSVGVSVRVLPSIGAGSIAGMVAICAGANTVYPWACRLVSSPLDRFPHFFDEVGLEYS